MKAWQVTRYAGVDALEWRDVDEPVPGPGQVRFRVEASSVNPIDWKMAKVMLRWLRPMRFPWTPTFDGAGVVDAVGPGVSGWQVGDRLAVRLGSRAGGTSAELCVADTEKCARLPDAIDFEAGAAVPLAGMTAWQGLFDAGGMPRDGTGLRVLVGLAASRPFLKPGAVYLTPFPKPGDNLTQLVERLADGLQRAGRG
ncbi:MAG: hypothetical protein RIT45_1948 [Pseudomonadota bacterium]|jgi:NADPH:quinone reductase-like Zn-dependent oxidoreductase